MNVIAQSGAFRVVDDLPDLGGYYSVEACKMYGDMKVWERVSRCTSNYDEIMYEFEKFIS